MARNVILVALIIMTAVTGVTGCETTPSQTVNQISPGGSVYESSNDAPLNWPVPSFKGIDENGKSFYSSQLKGHVWIADVFYSSCPTVCSPIASNMAYLQKQLKRDRLNVQIVSFSVDPQNETPAILKKFGEERGANFSNWHFLTGYSYKWIQHFSLEALKEPISKTQGSQIYSHTVNWYLVDKSGKIVSLFDGLQPTYDKIVQATKSLE